MYFNTIKNFINKNGHIEIDFGYLLGLFRLTSVYTQDMNMCFNELLNKIIYLKTIMKYLNTYYLNLQ
jgi:hypothetical protein